MTSGTWLTRINDWFTGDNEDLRRERESAQVFWVQLRERAQRDQQQRDEEDQWPKLISRT